MIRRFRGLKRSALILGMLLVLSALATAQQKAAEKPEEKPAVQAQNVVPLTGDDLNQFTWRPIGPWPFSGRITNFAVPRGQSQCYYVLTATGGLWKTVDGGIHFDPLFEKYGNQSMGFLSIAPSDQNVLYLGTGEAIHARAAYHGNGMWKSTDAGRTWTHIGLEKSYYIPKVEVDFKNPDVVYVAAEGKLYDNEPDCERGLYKSVDGGKTWNRVLDLRDRGVADVVIDPANSDIVIATSYRVYRRTWTFLDRQPGNYIYKSVDGGKTWKKLTAGLPDLGTVETGRNGLALYEKNPKIIYIRLDQEIDLGLSEREGAANVRAGDIFKDDYYLNKFKTAKIPADLARLGKFTPITADTERALADKLNDVVKDGKYLTTLGLDLAAFTRTARKVYAKDKETLEAIGEVEKILKKETTPPLWKKVNDLVVLALFSGSPGIEFKEGFRVTDAGQLKVNKDFAGLIAYDPKGIKDEKDLAARLSELAAYPDFTVNLRIDGRRVMSQAIKTYKDNKDLLDRFKGAEDLAKEYEDTKGRYQLINRYVLQTAYAEALKPMEPVKKPGVIYRSEDEGETWAQMTEYRMSGGSDPVNPTEAGYYGRLNIDPNNDQILYTPDTRTGRSNDGGKTFKFAGWEGNMKTHVDHRAAWIDPLNSNHILSANDGGACESWDGGSHWSQKDTVSAQQFYDVSVDNMVPYNVMGGTQDNGCWIGPSMNRNPNGVYAADWLYLPTGDGFFAVRDWWNPEFIYYESQFGASSRMNLMTGERIGLSPRNTPEEDAAGNPAQRYQWNSPIVLSPHNPGIVYVCSQYVHRSLSHGDRDTWQTVSPDLSKADQGRIALSRKTNLQYATIFTFAESPKKPGLYWAGTDDGNLQMSPDGGQTWTNITANFYDKGGKLKKGLKGAIIPYDRWVARVLPSAHDTDTCYVVYSGYRTNNEDTTYIFVTRDLGKTFEDISGGMNNPVNDIEEDPDNANVLYIATDYGVFVTFDKGKAWTNLSTTAPNVVMKDLVIQARERDLVVATYGRGIYIVDISPFKEFTPETFGQDTHLFDIKDQILWKRFDQRGGTLGEFAKADNPPPGATIYYYLKNQANKVTLSVKDATGAVIQELNGKIGKGIQKVQWNLTKRSDQSGDEGMARMRRFRQAMADPGIYTIVLSVNGREVGTKTVTVKEDPLDHPII
jgi:photosystem II stability/assembly factor-like uncharacterized protein